MSQGKKMTFAAADLHAGALLELFAAACERIAVAGSIRRRKPLVGDIEIVAIPKTLTDLFGAPTESILDATMEKMVHRGGLQPLKGGARYKQFHLPAAGCNLDLFLTTPEQWGVIFLIRTGPANFSHQLVTPRHLGGKYLPWGWKVEGGRLLNETGRPLDTPEETDVFRHLGIPFLRPENRQ